MSKTYILQKDLPDVKAGAKLTINERGDLYFLKSDNGSIPYISELVENNPSWFLPEPQITNIIFSNGIEITTPDQSFVPNSVKVNGITFDLKLDEENKKYTEQDMRECFMNGRRKSVWHFPRTESWDTNKFTWLSFDNYLEYINTSKDFKQPTDE